MVLVIEQQEMAQAVVAMASTVPHTISLSNHGS